MKEQMPIGSQIAESKKLEKFFNFSNGKAMIEEDGYIQYVITNKGEKLRPGDEVKYERGNVTGEAYIAEFYFSKDAPTNGEVEVRFIEDGLAIIRVQDIKENISEQIRKTAKERKGELLIPKEQGKKFKERINPMKENLPILEKMNPLQFYELLKSAIAFHPDFKAFKEADHCPEGLFENENGEPYIQMVCRCKDGEVRALRATILKDGNENGDMIVYDSREFDEKFSF